MTTLDDCDEYELWFDAYTPETIPLGRLAEYMAALSKLLGHEASVHFSELRSGSTVSAVRVEREAAPKVADRVHQAEIGTAANDAIAAFNEINGLLRGDNAIGELKRRPSGGEQAVVLRFPGRESVKPERFGPFTENASVDGELVRIGGKDKTAHAHIVDADGRSWAAELSKDLAQRMAPFLYKGPVLRVDGDARWERDEDGVWKLLGFRIKDFRVLGEDGLLESVQKARELRDSDWASSKDIDGMVQNQRGHEDELH